MDFTDNRTYIRTCYTYRMCLYHKISTPSSLISHFARIILGILRFLATNQLLYILSSQFSHYVFCKSIIFLQSEALAEFKVWIPEVLQGHLELTNSVE